ncbi:MAG: ABC transporter substrate-binding protein [Deltaproteobacteria bacterium]|nr:ABC transporter substrate-binding protein [Deltaproteobacteria bacterium]
MKKIISLLIALTFLSSAAYAGQTIRFGVPPWPGVTVKTAVVTQILETLGHKTKQLEVGPTIIYKAMTSGEMEVMMAAWAPHHNDMVDPLIESGELVRAATNQDDSKTSLCVPAYVWDAGVHSFADLNLHADKFDKTIYNLEAGSGMNTAMEKIIDQDIAGLKDWEQVGSNLAAMMMEVGSKIKQQKWVTFGCWGPHWMNTIYDIRYLEGVPGTEKFVNEPSIDTVVSKDFSVQFPEAYKFLQHFKVSAATESQWIYSFSYDNVEPEKVAHDWISANLDTVTVWLEGVKGPDGKPAIEAIRAEF